MSADMDEVFRDENDQRQLMNLQDQQAEMMTEQEYVDRMVLARIKNGETTHLDYLYMVGRLNYNLNDLEK